MWQIHTKVNCDWHPLKGEEENIAFKKNNNYRIRYEVFFLNLSNANEIDIVNVFNACIYCI